MNPYEADPDKIPENDRYSDVPFYGRYFPHPDDFKPDPEHINSTTTESLKYWEDVLKKCDATVRIYDNQNGGRDVFALGSVIIKSSHLKSVPEGRRAFRDYSFADANEVKAIARVKEAFPDIGVPEIYFANKVTINIKFPRSDAKETAYRFYFAYVRSKAETSLCNHGSLESA